MSPPLTGMAASRFAQLSRQLRRWTSSKRSLGPPSRAGFVDEQATRRRAGALKPEIDLLGLVDLLLGLVPESVQVAQRQLIGDVESVKLGLQIGRGLERRKLRGCAGDGLTEFIQR
jgi:hypothetical protein